MQHHRGRLAALAHGERRADLRMQAIGPRGLDEHMATMRIPRLRDRPASLVGPTGVFARHEAEIGHELARRCEPPPINEFRSEHHRAVYLQATKALQRGDRGRIRGRQRECFDVRIERIAARQLVLEECEVFAKHQLIFGGEGGRRPVS